MSCRRPSSARLRRRASTDGIQTTSVTSSTRAQRSGTPSGAAPATPTRCETSSTLLPTTRSACFGTRHGLARIARWMCETSWRRSACRRGTQTPWSRCTACPRTASRPRCTRASRRSSSRASSCRRGRPTRWGRSTARGRGNCSGTTASPSSACCGRTSPAPCPSAGSAPCPTTSTTLPRSGPRSPSTTRTTFRGRRSGPSSAASPPSGA
mmetsp:Transcript_34921/g.108643  ORF Transcript_34921/g.108643 Transcript_34921/m.108643 type:complete len:210 (+) Transcript_34921:472-1101(+)